MSTNTKTTQYCLLEAIRLKELGLDMAANGLNAPAWIEQARAVAFHLAAKHGETDINEVLKLVPRPPNVSLNVTGAIFRHKRFKCVGYRQSAKISSHARTVKIWALAD